MCELIKIRHFEFTLLLARDQLTIKDSPLSKQNQHVIYFYLKINFVYNNIIYLFIFYL